MRFVITNVERRVNKVEMSRNEVIELLSGNTQLEDIAWEHLDDEGVLEVLGDAIEQYDDIYEDLLARCESSEPKYPFDGAEMVAELVDDAAKPTPTDLPMQ